jgi:hypothetical protein
MTGLRRITPTLPFASFDGSIEVTGRHAIEPFGQGSFDKLCGLLAVINGIRLARHGYAPVSKAFARRLFETGTDFLDSKGCLSDSLVFGMGTGRWHALVRKLAKQASTDDLIVEVERAGFTAEPDIEDIFAWIDGSLAQGRPVLTRLNSRPVDHFTVIAGSTATRLELFDSCGRRFIKRASCQGPGSFYRIPPKALLRIAVSPRG